MQTFLNMTYISNKRFENLSSRIYAVATYDSTAKLRNGFPFIVIKLTILDVVYRAIKDITN